MLIYFYINLYIYIIYIYFYNIYIYIMLTRPINILKHFSFITKSQQSCDVFGPWVHWERGQVGDLRVRPAPK